MIALALLAAATAAAPPPAPSPERLKTTVSALVGFGTRHTLSTTTDPKRGIGAARTWAAGEFERIGKDCGGCITVERISRTVTGARAPDGVRIEDVLGIQPGRDPNRVVIIGGHIDSRVTDIMDSTSDAPGANDDASGVAVVLEAARLLSKKKFDATIVYAVFSGEEQGLFGGALLADTAKARGWRVTAMLNNDIVGNSIGQGGVKDANRVRVFSEGIRASEDMVEQLRRRGEGGEDDGPSRALAKAIDGVAATLPGNFDVVLDQRPDRFGRGGDHEPFLKLGYPAVRFSVGAENWDAQHQDLRTENRTVYGDTIDRMDLAYLAHVAAINVATIDRLAAAPAAPAEVSLVGDLSRDTKVSWDAVPGAAGYRVHWRRNDGTGDWTKALDVTATATTLKQVPVDDHFIGVSALAKDGTESLVTFGGRATRR
ncbi:M20/M25/M40 family metallo-hydrolase [Sphingomonas oligophenolica]|uniref:M20/M25/M40 family metallo-hydrolase n=1 Tax=Sphingomonas oligophenolica TaxID=301154 RepID=A0A502CIS9_9SPHN|nr:M20/M25/M40 family metallo-hydrolase [Sphingomonas oligophenolica]TPG13087.1 M20/M25/M40 family metallo-hydrolase [Sphingomonas oligophenolica]